MGFRLEDTSGEQRVINVDRHSLDIWVIVEETVMTLPARPDQPDTPSRRRVTVARKTPLWHARTRTASGMGAQRWSVGEVGRGAAVPTLAAPYSEKPGCSGGGVEKAKRGECTTYLRGGGQSSM